MTTLMRVIRPQPQDYPELPECQLLIYGHVMDWLQQRFGERTLTVQLMFANTTQYSWLGVWPGTTDAVDMDTPEICYLTLGSDTLVADYGALLEGECLILDLADPQSLPQGLALLADAITCYLHGMRLKSYYEHY